MMLFARHITTMANCIGFMSLERSMCSNQARLTSALCWVICTSVRRALS